MSWTTFAYRIWRCGTMTTVTATTDTSGPQTFRRTGTAAFGTSALVLGMAALAWLAATPQPLQQTGADYAFGGAAIGAFAFFIFRVSVWPAVVVGPGVVVVRNPLVDHELIGGSPRLAPAFRGITVEDGDVHIPVFALSSSLLDYWTGSRTTKRLQAALERREPGAGPAVWRRNRRRILRQAPAFVAAYAIVGALADVMRTRH